MKRCPQCGREYDNSMMFCLDDGAELLYGPASMDEQQTAILHSKDDLAHSATRDQIKTTEQTAVFPSGITASPKPKTFNKKLLLSAPLALTIIILIGFFFYRCLNRVETRIPSIAVLPFANATGDAEADFLAEGIAETLINNFTKIPELKVAARSTALRFRGREGDPQAVGRELGVASMLTGRLMQRGDVLSIQVDLIDAADGSQIWGNRYEGKLTDVVNIQQRLTNDVSRQLQHNLSGTQEKQIADTYPQNPAAYQSYLRGRYHWNKRTTPDILRSIEFFRESVSLDPNYALGYAGLADALNLSVIYYAADAKTLPEARQAAMKAVSLDENLAEAHAALCYATMNEFRPVNDMAGAERQCRRAIELNPSLGIAYHYYGLILSSWNRHDEAIDQLRRALEIEPLSLLFNRSLGDRLNGARRFDEAIAQYKKTLELDSGYATAYYPLAVAYQMKGEYAPAVECFTRYLELSGDRASADLLREIFKQTGWEGFLHAVTERRIRFNLGWHSQAAFYATLGETDKAFADLERAYKDLETPAVLLHADPRFATLREDARYREFLRRLNMPE